MRSAPNGSVTQRDALRPDLLAFDSADQVIEDDIEWMLSITGAAMRTYDEIGMLIIMSNYEGSKAIG